MAKKPTHAQFINAIRSKGMLPHFGLGGFLPIQPAPKALGPATISPMTTPGGPMGAVQQGGLAGSLTAQNPYSAQLAPISNVNYTPTLNAAVKNSLAQPGQLNTTIANENTLAGQLAAQAAGTGPNPAQAALNQSTGANVANTAALMAGQRGAAGNVGLLAREAAQQGAATQQNAVGQAATLQAQQQLAARQQQAALQGQIGSQVLGEQSASNQLFGEAAAAGNTQNANIIGNYGQAQGLNAQISQQNANAVNGTTGGIINGVAGAISAIPAMVGGAGSASTGTPNSVVSGVDTGSQVTPVNSEGVPQLVPESYADGGLVDGPTSDVGKLMANGSYYEGQSDETPAVPTLTGPAPKAAAVSPGSQVVSGLLSALPFLAMAAKGGKVTPVSGEAMAAKGMSVPGKAKVKGDSLKNDNVPAMLSPGEIVIPRRITQDADAPSKAAQFVAAIQAKQGFKRKPSGA